MWCRLSRDVALAGHLLDQDSPRCHVTLPEAKLKLVIKFDNLNSIKLLTSKPSESTSGEDMFESLKQVMRPFKFFVTDDGKSDLWPRVPHMGS